jgi:hypothetical protein
MTRRLDRRRPDSAFVSHDELFCELRGEGARLELVLEADAHEGPVYAADEDALCFTTLPKHGHEGLGGDESALELASRAVTIVRKSDTGATGMTLGPDDTLLVCEQGNRTEPARIAVVERATGHTETVVENWEGGPRSGPHPSRLVGAARRCEVGSGRHVPNDPSAPAPPRSRMSRNTTRDRTICTSGASRSRRTTFAKQRDDLSRQWGVRSAALRPTHGMWSTKWPPGRGRSSGNVAVLERVAGRKGSG